MANHNQTPDFQEHVDILKNRIPNTVAEGWPDGIFSPRVTAAMMEQFNELGIPVETVKADKDEHRNYMETVDYKKKYPRYYPGNFDEKTLEHFLAHKLLKLQPGENFIDIGAEKSPHNKIFGKLTGCIGYRQDLSYGKGFHRMLKRIGGDAADLPVPDQFFQAALADCAIEHFENESDIGFMKQMARVLSVGGRVLIIPLYLFKEPFYLTDPVKSAHLDVPFETGKEVRCVENWGNRHGRFYSPQTLKERLIDPNGENMRFTVIHLENVKDIFAGAYCHFALMGTRIK